MTVPNLMYIEGEWTPASDGAKIDIINPADEEKIDDVPVATKDDLGRALESADKAWRSWKDVEVWTRSAKIRQQSFVQGQNTGTTGRSASPQAVSMYRNRSQRSLSTNLWRLQNLS